MKETTPLINNSDYNQTATTDNNPSNNSSNKTWFGKKAYLGLSTMLVIVGVLVISYVRTGGTDGMSGTGKEMSSSSTTMAEKSSVSGARSSGVAMTVTNEYSGRVGFEMFDYPFLQKAHLMEPYRESIVTTSGLSSKCGVSWSLLEDEEESKVMGSSIEGGSSAVVKSGYADTASKFMVTPKGPGKFLFQLKQSCVDGGSHYFTVYVKYVRRELMSLTDTDREEFLDALKTLTVVNTVDGRALYGDDYKSFQYLAQMHNDAVTGDCDQFHGGPGFVSNHVFLGAYLEQSLQLVNPRTALHYMEYTKYFESDSFQVDHPSDANDGGTWTEIFTEKWFGSNDPLTGKVVDGRWANMQLPILNDAFFTDHGIDKYSPLFPNEDEHKYNPYGLLRAPWNFNPSRSVTRFNNVNHLSNTTGIDSLTMYRYSGVLCDYYEDFLQEKVIGQPLGTLLDSIEGRTHGFTHFTIGGVGGTNVVRRNAALTERFGFSDTDNVVTSAAVHALIKNYITSFDVGKGTYLECFDYPFNYDTGKVDEDLEPYCKVSATYTANEAKIDEFLSEVYAGGKPSQSVLEKVSLLHFSEKKALVELLMTNQYDGDLAGSSAATDPIFWVLHGAVERLFQRIMFEEVLSDMSYVVDGVISGCSGHAPNGTKAWLEGYYLLDRTIAVSNLTNVELVNILDPRSDAYASQISFVYESSSWDWCPDFDSYFTLESKRPPSNIGWTNSY